MAVVQNWRWKNELMAAALSLNGVAFNISTFGGRTRSSGRRASNVVVPYRHGSIWVPKYYEERTFELAMWVIGADKDTGDIPADPEAEFWDNVQTLQQALYTDRTLGVLTKKHPVHDTDVVAAAEIANVVDFTTQAGATRAAFFVEFILPYVWFEDSALTGEGSYTARAHLAEWDLPWIQSDVKLYPVINLKAVTGTPSNPKIIFETQGEDFWLLYADVFATGEEVIIDVAAWTAVLDATSNVINNVDWSGQPHFAELLPGTNHVRVEVTNGPISVQVQWKGKYW